MAHAVEVRGVSKSYDNSIGLHPTDLNIKQGMISGLIGPDGAGKTTLLRIISTVMKFDTGNVNVLGYDARANYRSIRVRVGYMPGRFSLYQDLSVIENITFFASVFGVEIKEALRRVDDIYSQLSPFADRRAGALSGGMKQKLALCCALVHKPELLLLDEPTTGVDAVSRREFWDMLAKLNKDGMTIVVSTPYMDEAARCSSVSLMQGGRIMKTGAPADLVQGHRGDVLAIRTSQKFATLQLLRTHPNVDHVHTFGETIHYTDRRGSIHPDDMLHWLSDHETPAISAELVEPGIEDVFIQMMLEGSHDQ